MAFRPAEIRPESSLDILADGGRLRDGKSVLAKSFEMEADRFADEFLDLAARHPNFTYVPALSDEPADSDWSGRRQYVHEAAREHFANDFRGHKAYLCGPPIMIESCVATLIQGRLFERDIYTEKFFSAADAQQIRSPLFKRI